MTISRSRWLAKKLARYGLASGVTRVTSLGLSGRSQPAARVLMYHRIGKAIRDPWCVDTEAFEQQVRWLAERGLAISHDELLAFAEGRGSAPNGAVLITSDDGYQSVLTRMAPVLHRYGVPAVAFVTTSRVGSDANHGPEPYMNWDEVARLLELGVTVGSHAHTHRSLGRMSIEQAREEGARSRDLLRSRLGVEIDSFAYPYGMRPDHSREIGRTLEALGYRSVFTAMHGAVRVGTDPLSLPRVKIEGGEGLPMFQRLCAGALDAWRLFDESGSWLQRPTA